MMTEELIPWIASQCRIRPERQHAGIGGSSLGALVSLYLGLRYPKRFGKLAVLSPSVWWNRKSILGYIDEMAPRVGERPRLWLDVGELECARTVEDAVELNRHVETQGWVPGETLHFERVPDGTHSEASWARRVRPMLSSLFAAQPE